MSNNFANYWAISKYLGFSLIATSSCNRTLVSVVPDAAPTALKGHPINSSSIHISWEGIPPSPFKEQLLGYRIKYRRRESLSFNEVNVTSNTTKAVLSRLDPMTKYEITVNGFNEVGHGPSGKVLVVRTLQSGKLAIMTSSVCCIYCRCTRVNFETA